MHIRSLLVTGYRHTDLGIFSDKDARVALIKKVIRQDLIHFLENGTEWFVFTGNLGFEYWVLQVLLDLKQEGYDCQIATIFPFENHGQNWNEANREKLAAFKAVDFVKFTYTHYENPGQFRAYNQFLLDNTDGAYLFYEPENETNLKYLHNLLLKKAGYTDKRVTFDRLNEVAENFEEFE